MYFCYHLLPKVDKKNPLNKYIRRNLNKDFS
jgi:hypothetical protein